MLHFYIIKQIERSQWSDTLFLSTVTEKTDKKLEEPAAAWAPAGSSRISIWLRLKQGLKKSIVKTGFHFPAAGSGSSGSGDSAGSAGYGYLSPAASPCCSSDSAGCWTGCSDFADCWTDYSDSAETFRSPPFTDNGQANHCGLCPDQCPLLVWTKQWKIWMEATEKSLLAECFLHPAACACQKTLL